MMKEKKQIEQVASFAEALLKGSESNFMLDSCRYSNRKMVMHMIELVYLKLVERLIGLQEEIFAEPMERERKELQETFLQGYSGNNSWEQRMRKKGDYYWDAFKERVTLLVLNQGCGIDFDELRTIYLEVEQILEDTEETSVYDEEWQYAMEAIGLNERIRVSELSMNAIEGLAARIETASYNTAAKQAIEDMLYCYQSLVAEGSPMDSLWFMGRFLRLMPYAGSSATLELGIGYLPARTAYVRFVENGGHTEWERLFFRLQRNEIYGCNGVTGIVDRDSDGDFYYNFLYLLTGDVSVGGDKNEVDLREFILFGCEELLVWLLAEEIPELKRELDEAILRADKK